MSVILFPFVLYLIFITGFCGRIATAVTSSSVSAECQSWQDIKKLVQHEKSEEINCVVNSNCTGLGCSGKYKEYDFKTDIKINACETPVTLDVIFNIPKLSMNNTKHTFHDGQQYKLPKIVTPSDAYIEVSIKRQGQIIILGVDLKTNVEILNSWKTFPLIKNQTINIPICKNATTVPSKVSLKPSEKRITTEASVTPTVLTSSKKICSEKKDCNPTENCSLGECICINGTVRDVLDKKCVPVHELQRTGKPCNMTILKQCLQTEMCLQINESSHAGECVCLDHFHPDVDKNCVEDSPSKDKHVQSVTITLAIAVPILILMVCGSFIFVVIKFRLVHRFQVYKRGVRTYEVVDIGNDEDDDEPLVT